MNNRDRAYFPSKILLFGEYTVTTGSDALAIPFGEFYGKWKFNKTKNNKILYLLSEYLRKTDWNEFNSICRCDELDNDITNGLYFDSNIKTGYGAGSSGALSAGIFYSYFATNDNSISNLKRVLAKIESFFHGVSSGIDPLVSLLNQPVNIMNTGIETCNKNILDIDDFSFYLLDSKISRSTKKYVNIYKRKMHSKRFSEEILKPLTFCNNKIIGEMKKNNPHEIFALFKKISRLQFQGFEEMIISGLKPIWKNILSREDISIKLCGAGGGGYYLIMAKKNMEVSEMTKYFPLTRIS